MRVSVPLDRGGLLACGGPIAHWSSPPRPIGRRDFEAIVDWLVVLGQCDSNGESTGDSQKNSESPCTGLSEERGYLSHRIALFVTIHFEDQPVRSAVAIRDHSILHDVVDEVHDRAEGTGDVGHGRSSQDGTDVGQFAVADDSMGDQLIFRS